MPRRICAADTVIYLDLPTMPWLMTHTPKPEVTGSPCFGEHSQEVFALELGISEDEYVANRFIIFFLELLIL